MYCSAVCCLLSGSLYYLLIGPRRDVNTLNFWGARDFGRFWKPSKNTWNLHATKVAPRWPYKASKMRQSGIWGPFCVPNDEKLTSKWSPKVTKIKGQWKCQNCNPSNVKPSFFVPRAPWKWTKNRWKNMFLKSVSKKRRFSHLDGPCGGHGPPRVPKWWILGLHWGP